MLRQISLIIIGLLLLPAVLFAQLGFDPDPGFGWEFPDTPVGEISDIEVIVFSLNDEDAQMVVIEIGVEPDQDLVFGVGPINEFRLEPGDEQFINFSFAPEEAGRFGAVIEFHALSNDPDNPDIVYQFELSGRGIELRPPQIEVEPDDLDLWFVSGIGGWVHTEEEITISNTGQAVLRVGRIDADEEWLLIDRENFAVEPGEAEVITVTVEDPVDFAIGDHFTTITILCNDPENQMVEIPVVFTRDHVIWIPDPQEASHSIIIMEARIDGELLELGDYIGVFTPEGILAGASEISNPDEPFPVGLAAWGDNPDTPLVEGFINGQMMMFRIWDTNTGTEYDAVPVYARGVGFWQINGLSVLAELNNVPIEELPVIELPRGWSMISSDCDFSEEFCNDDGPDFQLILEDILEEVIIFKNIQGQFCIPEMDFYMFNTWDVSQGYLVKVSEDVDLEIHGEPIEFDRPIELQAGWNMIAYYPDYEAYFENACEGILDHVIIAKDGMGRFWVDEFNFPVLPMIPGWGYMIKVDEDCQLRYPLEDPDENEIAGLEVENCKPVHFPQPVRTGENMSILIESLQGFQILDDSEIACFNRAGKCVGVTGITADAPWGMAAWGDDHTTEETDGLTDGEAIVFKLWDASNGEEYTLASGNDSEVIYSKDAFTKIELAASGKNTPTLTVSKQVNAYAFPNPFNGKTTLHFNSNISDPTEVTIFDLTGKVISAVEVNPVEAGFQSVSLDLGYLPDGIYLVKVHNNQGSQVLRTLLLK